MTELTNNEDQHRLICPVCGSNHISHHLVRLTSDLKVWNGEFRFTCLKCGKAFNLPDDEPESEKESEAR